MTIAKKVSGSILHAILDVIVDSLNAARKHIGFWDIFVVLGFAIEWGVLYFVSAHGLSVMQYLLAVFAQLAIALIAAFSDEEKVFVPKTKIPLLALVAFLVAYVGISHDLALIDANTVQVNYAISVANVPLTNPEILWTLGSIPLLIIILVKLIVEPYILTKPQRRVAQPLNVVPQAEQTVRVEPQPVQVPVNAKPVSAQTTGLPKSWNDIAADLWNFQPLKEQFRLLVEGVKDTVWPDEEKKPGDVFFKGFIGDIKRLQLPVPKDSDNLSGTFIWMAQQLLEQHEVKPFANLDEFLDAREALLKANFSK